MPHAWERGKRSPGSRGEEPATPHLRLRSGLALGCPRFSGGGPPCRTAPPSSDRRKDAYGPCTLPSRRDSVAPGRVPSSKLSCPLCPHPGDTLPWPHLLQALPISQARRFPRGAGTWNPSLRLSCRRPPRLMKSRPRPTPPTAGPPPWSAGGLRGTRERESGQGCA